jgi:hypothetical protein
VHAYLPGRDLLQHYDVDNCLLDVKLGGCHERLDELVDSCRRVRALWHVHAEVEVDDDRPGGRVSLYHCHSCFLVDRLDVRAPERFCSV